MNMANVKPKTIFSKIPFFSSEKNENDAESKKISFWLKKLYEQGGQRIRKEQTGTPILNKTAYVDDVMLPTTEVVMKSPETKGLEQYTTNQKLKEENDKHIVEELVKKSNRRIISISSTFPFTIFPNTIDVEESRVSFNFRQFLTYQSHSVDIKDITNVFIESGIVFASLQVVSKTFTQNHIKIDYLRKGQAVHVRRIIEGLRTFIENKIDTSKYEIDELISKLEELNTTNHV